MEVAKSFKTLVRLISGIDNEGIIEPEFLSDDFIRSIQEVFDIRRIIIDQRWNSFIDTCYTNMMSSPEMYLTFIMYACISEHEDNENVFDSFIDVYAVLTNLLSVLSTKTRVDFLLLVPDIFIVFYLTELQDDLCNNGGTRQLVEYIRNHRLLRGKRKKNNRVLSDYSTMNKKAKKRYLKKKIEKEYGKDRLIKKATYPEEVEHHEKSCVLAKAALSFVGSAEFPMLTCYMDVITRLVALRKKNAKEIAGAKKTESNVKPDVDLKGCSSSFLNSKTDYNKDNPDNIERYENIIQAVIRHNRSKSSSNEYVKCQIQKDADGIIEHLKKTIKSLAEILEEQTREK